MPAGCLALPVRSNHEVIAGVIASGAAADVAIVVGVAIDELNRVVAFLLNGRHRHHHRLSPQVQPQHRIRRVTVGRDDGRVLVGEDAGIVVNLIEGRLELAGVAIHGKRILDRVVHHDRQPVDEALLGDRFRLLDARRWHALSCVFLFSLGDRVIPAAARDQHRPCRYENGQFHDDLHVSHPLGIQI